MRFDTVIKNRIIVTATDTYAGDIGVNDGRITAIMAGLPVENTAKVIDATGKMVMPGGGDVHTHLDMPFGGTNSADDFTKIPNGGPGIEHRLSLVYTGGVHGGRFSPNRFVQLVATAPAKLFGLFPRKGTIAVGSDADIVVFDANQEQVISASTHHMKVDYSMFEGIRVKGVPKHVLSRGRTIIENSKFVGKAGSGEFIKRQQYTGI